MRSDLILPISVIALMFFISSISPNIINTLLSLVVTIFSFGCFGLIYLVHKYPAQNESSASNSVSSKIFLAFFMFSLSLLMGWSTYLFMLEPNAIECKYNFECEMGPYGWSVALLTFGVSLLTFYISLVLASSAFKRN